MASLSASRKVKHICLYLLYYTLGISGNNNASVQLNQMLTQSSVNNTNGASISMAINSGSNLNTSSKPTINDDELNKIIAAASDNGGEFIRQQTRLTREVSKG